MIDHIARQALFAEALRRAGLAGAVVFSRGGSTLDRYADIFYLTGFYQSYVYMPETPGLFSGRAHAAFVIDASGRNRLCVAVPEFEPGTVVADDIRAAGDFAGNLADAMRELGLGSARVGLIGADVLTYEMNALLIERLPTFGWVRCEELLHSLRRIKSEPEMDIIRRAAGLHVKALDVLKKTIAPGCTEAELIAAFSAAVLREGGDLYFTALSSGPNIDRLCSRPLPGFSTRPIKQGDMLRFDTGIVLDGYLSDFGRTLVVGTPTGEQLRLLEVLHTALDEAIAAVRVGAKVRDIANAGESALARLGADNPDDTGPSRICSGFPVHWGHGLGMGWERPWIVTGDDTPIEAGMYLAIERSLYADGVGVASAEQTMLVHVGSVGILSEGADGRWQ